MARMERTEADQSIEGLASIMEGNSQVCQGVSEHLQEMNLKQELAPEIDECAAMCRDIAEKLRQ